MMQDISTTAVDGHGREFRSEADWRSLMAEFARFGGTQKSFCESRGVSLKSNRVNCDVC